MFVAIVLGSANDFPKVRPACDFLKKMGVEFQLRALSAHRTGDQLEEFMKENDKDIAVYLAAAGMAAHLPGVIAAKTAKPVIGIPITSKALDGMDALLAIVQMPPGVPVATVAIDGAKNAAILACQIMATADQALAEKMLQFKNDMVNDVLAAEKKLLEEINNEYK